MKHKKIETKEIKVASDVISTASYSYDTIEMVGIEVVIIIISVRFIILTVFSKIYDSRKKFKSNLRKTIIVILISIIVSAIIIPTISHQKQKVQKKIENIKKETEF